MAATNGIAIQLWNLRTGKQIGREFIGDRNWIKNMSFSRDGKMLASGGYNGVIKIWDSETGKELWTIQGHRGGTGASIVDISVSPADLVLASVDNENTIKLWNFHGQNRPKMLKGQISEINSVSFNPNDKILALAGSDNFIELWHLGSQDTLRRLNVQLANINSAFNLDDLLKRGCASVRNFLQNNPNVLESDRHICDDIN